MPAMVISRADLERELLDEQVAIELSPVLFTPQSGKQTQAYESQADITGYGGAAGGGKSMVALGLAVTRHRRSIIFRREQDQVRDLWDKLGSICGSHGRSNENLLVWRDLPGGRTVRLAGVKNEGDWKKFQGHENDLMCVAAGTPVRMGDGTYRPIEKIRVGDLVATLEGPRQVTRALRMGFRDTVRVTARLGEETFTQIQSANHSLLTREGWASHDTLRESRQPESAVAKGRPGESRYEILSSLTHASGSPHRGVSGSGLALLEAQLRSDRDHQDLLACCADTAMTGLGSGFSASADEHQDGALLASGRRNEQGRPQRSREGAPFGIAPLVSEHDAFGARCLTGLPDSPARCSSAPHLDDGRARPYEVVARVCPQRLGDAVPQNPNGSVGGDREETPTHSRHTESWLHPYTMDIRQTQAALEETPVTMIPEGRQEVFDLTIDSANHYITGAIGLINKNCFDEATEFSEGQIRTLIAWNRTKIPGQRCRVMLGFNPPTTAEGQWIIDFFGPWLDPTHPNPAEPGDLRWYAVIDGKDVEQADGEPFIHNGEEITPLSRTFIPARLEDNPILESTGYRKTLQNVPEPLRSQLLYGDFQVGLTDDEWQVIPTSWVRAAQARWHKDGGRGEPLTAIGIDVAQGGADNTAVARRYGTWVAPIEIHPGTEVPDANVNCGHVLKALTDGGVAFIDADGIGASTYHLARAKVGERVQAYLGSDTDVKDERDSSGVLGFQNRRSMTWWKFRERLDPSKGSTIALPPERRILSELCAPRYQILDGKIRLERKPDLIKRIGFSPDYADAITMAFAAESYGSRLAAAYASAQRGAA